MIRKIVGKFGKIEGNGLKNSGKNNNFLQNYN
jgi:hypothetical protein